MKDEGKNEEEKEKKIKSAILSRNVWNFFKNRENFLIKNKNKENLMI